MTMRWIAMFLLAALPVAGGAAPVSVGKLRCEYQVDPLGIEAARPRLSWIIESTDRGQTQTAYQVLVAASPDMLAKDKGDLWDSGKVPSSQSILVKYSGKALESTQRCWWKVRIWDKGGKASAWSAPASWSMGILRPGDWHAKWIAQPGYDPSQPMPIFRRSFELGKSVSHAEVHACGLGQFELTVNGKPATDAVMEPGWTNYRKNCPYVSYDITNLLKQGRNALGVMLGNGMYNVVGGRYVKLTGSFGQPKLILQMHVTFSDGTTQVIATDSRWQVAPGPVTFSCTYGGEDYDASREPRGWDTAEFDASGWKNAAEVDGPGGLLAARVSPPIKVERTYAPVKVTEVGPNTKVYDLGQNMSGWPVIKVKGPAGSAVKITMDEKWDGKGPMLPWLNVSFTYKLKGEGEEVWHPRFTYYGHRYEQVELIPAPDGGLPQLIDIHGEFLHTASPVAGTFECSNDTVNRIHKLIDMAILCNYQSVLTDCPHREKLGWLEQAHLVFGGVNSSYDSAAFYTKIARDMAESQLADGLVPDIAPEYTVFSGGFRDSPEWGSAYVICPWQVYQTYGDQSLLEQHYEGMKAYTLYLKSKSQDGIVSYGLGDWYDVGPNPPGESQLTSKGLTATAIYYSDIDIMRRTAELLGKKDDAAMWADLAKQVNAAFNKRFFHPETRTYDTGSQTANAMPLVVGLGGDPIHSDTLQALVKQVRDGGNRVTAGDVGFKYLVWALAGAGRDDVLWDVVTQDRGPGYVWQLNSGATTLTEAWDGGFHNGSSMNHLMLGHAEEWFYRGLAGIQEDSPGYKTFSIRPAVVGDLTWVKAHYDCPYGRIESSWKLENGKLTMEVTVPANTTATIYVPAKSADSVSESGKPAAKAAGVKFVQMLAGRAVYSVQSGKYTFTVK